MDAGWLRVVGFSPRPSWRRVLLVSLVVRVVDVVVLLWCFVLLGWWGPLVDVDDAPGDVDAVGVMVCGVAVSTLGWGPAGWRWWRLFASRAGVLGVAVGGGALGVTLCRGRGGREAVPRTPWLGYGIQPVSGPLTPSTEGKTGLRSTNPMYGRRPLTPGASPAGACSVP